MYAKLSASLVPLFFICEIVIAQAINNEDLLENYLSHLPSDLKLREDSPQNYIFICDYFYLVPQGDVFRKQRVYGEYARALSDGKVMWKNVKISQVNSFEGAFPEGEKQDYMEGFTYDPKSNDCTKPEFFQNFPPSMIDTKNLIWDTIMLESFGWNFFDKLQLNVAYSPSEISGEVPLAGVGMFKNTKIELTWLGISEMNKEICALIQYRAFFNKFNISTEVINVNGGSHYWGEIWVSLEDKQIEYATLYESVMVETKLPGQESFQTGGAFRIGTFKKVTM